MRRLLSLLALLPLSLPAWDGSASDLANQIQKLSLDREECYRVRDLNFTKGDLRFYLTEGYLILGKPVAGRRISAVFAGNVETGDAEILLFPPNRGERLSLASATGSPNLNEHFRLAVMVFTDDTCETLLNLVKEHGNARKSPELGALMDESWETVARNLAQSFELRIVRDLLSSRPVSNGYFYAALSGEHLGNFDVFYDPTARQQITVGKLAYRNEHVHFDIWTSFEERAARNGSLPVEHSDVRVSNFRIDASLQPDLTLKVTTRVTLTPEMEGYRAVAFELSENMHITKALVDGMPAEVFRRGSMREALISGQRDNVILLVPARKLEVGRQYEVEFQHEGGVISEAGNGVYYVGSRGNWYPNRSWQFARCDVTFRYPASLDLVAGGDVVEQRKEGDWLITRRQTGAPVRFFGFNLGEYRKISLKRQQYTVDVCANREVESALQPKRPQTLLVPATPGWARRRGEPREMVPLELPAPKLDPAARLEELASEIADAFEFMAERFGPPPIRHLTVSPIPGTFGQGFPGLVYLSTISYLDPKQRPAGASGDYQQMLFSEILHAHETAHQWWGNVVTSASDRDDWLMEALANYSALLYLEKRKGTATMLSVLSEYRKRLLEKTGSGKAIDSVGPIIWGARLDRTDAPTAWHRITYEKGSWIIHMLRRRMGDERFFGMLSALRRRFEYKAVKTEEFRALAAEFQPPRSPDPGLHNFFDTWVYSSGIPTLELRYTTRGKGTSWKLTGTLMQSDVPDDFTIDVPVEIQLGSGKTETRWLKTDSQTVTFSANLRRKPTKVILAPGECVLAVQK